MRRRHSGNGDETCLIAVAQRAGEDVVVHFAVVPG